MPRFDHVLIVGAGEGLSASLARAFAREGAKIALAARRPEKLESLCRELGATAHRCDAAEPADVAALFRELDEAGRTPAAVVYNPSRRSRGPLVDLDPEEVRRTCWSRPTAASSSPRRRCARMLPRRRVPSCSPAPRPA